VKKRTITIPIGFIVVMIVFALWWWFQ